MEKIGKGLLPQVSASAQATLQRDGRDIMARADAVGVSADEVGHERS